MVGEAPERIAIESDADVVTARQRARQLAIGLDMPTTDQTLLATAISEVARNITAYAQRGEVTLDDLLEIYAGHGAHHAGQISDLRDRNGW